MVVWGCGGALQLCAHNFLRPLQYTIKDHQGIPPTSLFPIDFERGGALGDEKYRNFEEKNVCQSFPFAFFIVFFLFFFLFFFVPLYHPSPLFHLRRQKEQ